MERYDGAAPSGNSAALLLFEQLRRLSGQERWRQAAQRQADFLCAAVREAPMAGAFGLLGLMGQTYPTKELVCAAAGEERPGMLERITARFDPQLSVLLKRPGDEALARFAPFTAACGPVGEKAAFESPRSGSQQKRRYGDLTVNHPERRRELVSSALRIRQKKKQPLTVTTSDFSHSQGLLLRVLGI